MRMGHQQSRQTADPVSLLWGSGALWEDFSPRFSIQQLTGPINGKRVSWNIAVHKIPNLLAVVIARTALVLALTQNGDHIVFEFFIWLCCDFGLAFASRLFGLFVLGSAPSRRLVLNCLALLPSCLSSARLAMLVGFVGLLIAILIVTRISLLKFLCSTDSPSLVLSFVFFCFAS